MHRPLYVGFFWLAETFPWLGALQYAAVRGWTCIHVVLLWCKYPYNYGITVVFSCDGVEPLDCVIWDPRDCPGSLHTHLCGYGVATIRRSLKITGLCMRISSLIFLWWSRTPLTMSSETQRLSRIDAHPFMKVPAGDKKVLFSERNLSLTEIHMTRDSRWIATTM